MNIDTQDYKKLLRNVLTHAMDDYVKLQHPKNRRKKYLREAFSTAVDMFFDSEYRMLHLQTGDGTFMSLKDFLGEIMANQNLDIENIKEHVIAESRSFWETKMLSTVYIPDNVVFDGHVYAILKDEDIEDPEIDFQKKTIKINPDSDNTENQENFIICLVKIILYHEDMALSQQKITSIGKGVFKLLRMNACFITD
jgi:hypothetical protein